MARTLKRLLCALAAAAACQTASAHPALWISDDDGTLGIVSLASGTVSIVGQMRIIMTDIAFDTSGQLWGVSAASGLYRIDRETAAVSLVGALGQRVNSLVFDDRGTLYAANDALMTIDLATGAATLVGAGGGYSSSGDLAFVDGQLYLSSALPTPDTLYRVDPATGAGTAIGAGLGIGASGVFGLATADNVQLYGAGGNRLFAIDPATGLGSVVQTYDVQGGLGQAYGTAFTTEAASPVPEPPAAWLLASGLLLWALRRWRQQARSGATAV